MDEKSVLKSQNAADGSQDDFDPEQARVEANGFKGVFSGAMRRLLAHCREECGLAVSQISSMLGVDSSTYRKWEDGSVSRCRNCNIRPVRRFLLGELPPHDREEHHVPTAKIPARLSALESHFKSLLTIMSLLDGHPDLEERLIRGFEEYCESSRLQLAEALLGERKRDI